MGVFVMFLGLALAANSNFAATSEDTLELLQVFMRHGNRTAQAVIPGYEAWYQETFQPFEGSHLTFAGRQQAYQVGSYLRKRYDSFLPEEFSYTNVSVRCAATDRTQETSAVTMAAMFPPKDRQQWQESGLGALWTPIPCESVPADQDIVLDPASVKNCTRYNYLNNEYLNSTYYLNIYNELCQYGALQEYVTYWLNLTTPVDRTTFDTIWETILAMNDYKMPLPAWTAAVWPNPIIPMMTYAYFGSVYNQEIIRLGVGPFLKELLEVATLLENGQLTPKSRKLFAYFGHDLTIYPFLVALGFETFPQLCAYAATLIMELHRNKTTSEIGYKFLYLNGTYEEPIQYTVPGCQEICPLSYVKKVLEPYIPTEPYFDYC